MRELLFIIALLLSSKAQTQLLIQNTLSDTAKVAFAYRQNSPTYEGYICQGWITVPPGETVQALHENPTAKKLYYYYSTPTQVANGQFQFVVDTTANFRIKNATFESTLTENKHYKIAPFILLNRKKLPNALAKKYLFILQ